MAMGVMGWGCVGGRPTDVSDRMRCARSCAGVWRATTPGGNWEVKHCAVNIDGRLVFVVANFKATDMSITATQYELES